MDIAIEKKTRNDLLSRDEILAVATSEITPKKDEVRDVLAEKTGKNAELVVAKRIKGRFGSNEFLVEAYIYDNAEILKKLELELRKKPKAGEDKPAEPKPEKPAKGSEEKPPAEEQKKEEDKEKDGKSS